MPIVNGPPFPFHPSLSLTISEKSNCYITITNYHASASTTFLFIVYSAPPWDTLWLFPIFFSHYFIDCNACCLQYCKLSIAFINQFFRRKPDHGSYGVFVRCPKSPRSPSSILYLILKTDIYNSSKNISAHYNF